MKSCFRPNEDPLYVILPYFNFSNFSRRRELFIEFVNRIRNVKGIHIVVCEAVGPARLPLLKGLWRHLRIQTDCRIWLKENLVNIGIASLPSEWKYVSWIDADIQFLNENWARETVLELQVADVVQMFCTCVNLGPNGEAMKIDKAFGYMHKYSNTLYTKNDKYGFWHPGYAWACTKAAWLQMDGLLDWGILGSGDRHMALAMIGRVLDSAPGNIHENYKKLLEKFQSDCKGLRLSCVKGSILHFWHGKFENRKYRERWDILTKLKYDPMIDVGMNKKGLIQLTKTGQRFQNLLDEYFAGRREDD